MAHPYSSTAAYGATGTPSYAGQQAFYPPYQPNPFQQSVQTPPGLPHPPHPNHSMAPYQPSPSNNAARFDANSQVRPPAPPFPFTPDIFKQFANAGLPPPPPPSIPPVPLPNSSYSHFSAPLNVSVSSPYPQHGAGGQNSFGSGFYATEQAHPNPQDPFTTSQHGSRGMGDFRSSVQSESQSYSVPRLSHGGNQQSSSAANRAERADREHDEVLPSFGSRSDIDQLFATVQKQVNLGPRDQDYDTGLHPHQLVSGDGNASPYDPTRPAVISSTMSGGFGLSKTKEPSSFERKYNTSSLTELRQAAKGALLSLVPHKILYADLINEGIDSSTLQHLYDELGISFDRQGSGRDVPAPGQSQVDAPPGVKVPGLPQTDIRTDVPAPQKVSTETSGLPQVETTSGAAALPVIKDLAKQNTAPSPSLERKDRIAQLLAAKTGRTSAAYPAAPSSSPRELSSAPSAVRLGDANLDGSSFFRPESTDDQAKSISTQQKPGVQNHIAKTQAGKQQNELLSQQALATPRGPKSNSEVPYQGDALSTKVAQQIGQIAANQVSLGEKQSALASLIPGLFMTSVESAANDVVMAGITNDDLDARLQNAFSTSALPLKRPLQPESNTLPEAKRTNLSWDLQRTAEPAAEANAPDDASEGEIVEDADEGPMTVDDPRNENGFGGHGSAELDSYDQQAIAQLQGYSVNESAPGDSYRTKQSKIENVRQRISEMEERKELKPSNSQEHSPSVSNASMPLASRQPGLPSSSQAQQGDGRSGTNTPSELPRRPFALGKTVSKLTPAQLAERTAALKAEVLRQRAQRQQVLQAELPTLNTEVQKMETRLENARVDLRRAQQEVAKCQDELSRARKTEAGLVEEVRHLEKQVQDGHSGQKQYSAELHQIQRQKIEESEVHTDEPGENYRPQMQTNTDATATEGLAVQAPPGNRQDSSLPSNSIIQDDATMEEDSEVFPQSASAIIQPGHDDLNEDEMEISPEPEPTPIMMMAHPTTDENSVKKQYSEEPTMDDDQGSDGSASMSDSGSDRDDEDYEPADAEISQPMQHSDADEDSDEYDPEEAPVSEFTPATGADDEAPEDYYEPAESAGAFDTGFSGTPVQDTDYMNGSRQSTPNLDNPPADGVIEGVEGFPVNPLDRRPDHPEENRHLPEIVDLVKEDDRNGDEATSAAILDGRSPSSPFFVPYKTPLSSFKTFRFHQAFDDTVKTGYRSLTYSNNIDPSRPLCPTELSGELCVDPSCEEQHFRQLGLSDDKILVQMSSASDIKDKTQRDQYLVGLKQVIADLRQKEVKEFENVAQALSAYRRQFFAEKEEVS